MADFVYDMAVEAANTGGTLSFAKLSKAVNDLMLNALDTWRELEMMGGEEGIEWVVTLEGEKRGVDWEYSDGENEEEESLSGEGYDTDSESFVSDEALPL